MRTRNLDKQELVKQQAIEMLVKDGFDGFSMAKLAKASKISVATLYIYYQDKDDLIKQLGIEIGCKFFESALRGFSPDMPFAQGLKIQWDNRTEFTMSHRKETDCYEIIRHSPHGEYVLQQSFGDFKDAMKKFTQNAIDNKELLPLPMEVFWSIAYGPLYNMLRFHSEGKSFGNKQFVFTTQMKDEALALVIKALKP